MNTLLPLSYAVSGVLFLATALSYHHFPSKKNNTPKQTVFALCSLLLVVVGGYLSINAIIVSLSSGVGAAIAAVSTFIVALGCALWFLLSKITSMLPDEYSGSFFVLAIFALLIEFVFLLLQAPFAFGVFPIFLNVLMPIALSVIPLMLTKLRQQVHWLDKEYKVINMIISSAPIMLGIIVCVSFLYAIITAKMALQVKIATILMGSLLTAGAIRLIWALLTDIFFILKKIECEYIPIPLIFMTLVLCTCIDLSIAILGTIDFLPIKNFGYSFISALVEILVLSVTAIAILGVMLWKKSSQSQKKWMTGGGIALSIGLAAAVPGVVFGFKNTAALSAFFALSAPVFSLLITAGTLSVLAVGLYLAQMGLDLLLEPIQKNKADQSHYIEDPGINKPLIEPVSNQNGNAFNTDEYNNNRNITNNNGTNTTNNIGSMQLKTSFSLSQNSLITNNNNNTKGSNNNNNTNVSKTKNIIKLETDSQSNISN